MILDAFSLQGKVAVVSGCDTGLGQGMALGLAEAGCDIVGINIVEPVETIERVKRAGTPFSQPDRRPAPDRRYSSASGAGRWRSSASIDILGQQCRPDSPRGRAGVQRKRLGRRDEPQHQERIFYVPGGGETLYRPGQRREDH